MPIKPFSLNVPETRFLHCSKYVYKFKIRYGVCFSSQHIENTEQALQELVESIRAIIANQDNLNPFFTRHFIIFPYKRKWESASCLKFKYRHKSLLPFPYVFTAYLEPKSILHDGGMGTQRANKKEREDQQEHCTGQFKKQRKVSSQVKYYILID
ncbi:membrane-anchored junction protein [Mantella aurantiaca]